MSVAVPPGGTTREEGPVPWTIVTGERGAGKTTRCTEIVAASRERGVAVAGVISLSCADAEGRRWGLDALILPGERRLPLARVVDPAARPASRREAPAGPSFVLPPASRDRPPDDADAPRLGPFRFRRDTIAVVNRTLEDAAARAGPILIDEVGPLELRGEGFRPGLDAALRARVALVVVVRPSLVAQVSDLGRAAGRTPPTIERL